MYSCKLLQGVLFLLTLTSCIIPEESLGQVRQRNQNRESVELQSNFAYFAQRLLMAGLFIRNVRICVELQQLVDLTPSKKMSTLSHKQMSLKTEKQQLLTMENLLISDQALTPQEFDVLAKLLILTLEDLRLLLAETQYLSSHPTPQQMSTDFRVNEEELQSAFREVVDKEKKKGKAQKNETRCYAAKLYLQRFTVQGLEEFFHGILLFHPKMQAEEKQRELLRLQGEAKVVKGIVLVLKMKIARDHITEKFKINLLRMCQRIIYQISRLITGIRKHLPPHELQEKKLAKEQIKTNDINPKFPLLEGQKQYDSIRKTIESERKEDSWFYFMSPLVSCWLVTRRCLLLVLLTFESPSMPHFIKMIKYGLVKDILKQANDQVRILRSELLHCQRLTQSHRILLLQAIGLILKEAKTITKYILNICTGKFKVDKTLKIELQTIVNTENVCWKIITTTEETLAPKLSLRQFLAMINNLYFSAQNYYVKFLKIIFFSSQITKKQQLLALKSNVQAFLELIFDLREEIRRSYLQFLEKGYLLAYSLRVELLILELVMEIDSFLYRGQTEMKVSKSQEKVMLHDPINI